jgi:histidyl-tRNA synthetase
VYQIPRGTRDFTPDEMNKRSYVENTIKKTFESFGYREVQTPTFEHLELFTAKSGDAIIDELYSFQDKGGRNLALRPELTAPVMRLYVDKLQMEPKPLKLFYLGNCYRYDRPQKGRYREFTQAGCELIGTGTNEAYAELVALAYSLLKNVGLKNINLKIGNLNILKKVFYKLKLTQNQIRHITPLIDKSMFEDISSALKDFNTSELEIEQFLSFLQTNTIQELTNFVNGNNEALDEIKSMEKISVLLQESFGIENFEINMGIVRGLDYYKGLVFEIEAPSLGAEKQLCGGGAYELISLFGGKESPTSGFAIGFDRTIVALETEKYDFPKTGMDVYIIPVHEGCMKKGLEIVQNLRNNNIRTDIDLLNRGMGKCLKYASSISAKFVFILGERELEQETVTVRNMQDGEQESVKFKDIISWIKARSKTTFDSDRLS